jgi:Glycosyl transferases group 1
MSEEAVTFRPFMAHEAFTRHLQVMDLAVFPIFEGAGNWGLFEAMAAAVPILASDRCFIPEAIHHGHDGLLFDPRDIDGLVRTVLTDLDAPDRLRALGRRARQTVARRFSVERAADGYASAITGAARRARRAPVDHGLARRATRRHDPSDVFAGAAPAPRNRLAGLGVPESLRTARRSSTRLRMGGTLCHSLSASISTRDRLFRERAPCQGIAEARVTRPVPHRLPVDLL